MGVQLAKLIEPEIISIGELKNKTLVVDAFNMLYQFITTIRGPDGHPLTDKHGNITSHLVGIFFRVAKLMQENLKLAFVFDGKAPKLKQKERERRNKLKEQAQKKYDLAVAEDDTEAMAKYASRTAKLTNEMIEETKDLLKALGIPIIQAPSEGEAQAAYMVSKGDAWGLISQDYDCLLFGTQRMVKDLSISARRKKPGTFATTTTELKLITLPHVLKELNLTRQKLIELGVLIGTDFNIGGIKGIGPKKGLKLVQQYDDTKELFSSVKWEDFFNYSYEDVIEIFTSIPTTDEYDLTWKGVDEEKIMNLLVEKHDFSQIRVKQTLDKLKKQGKDRAQKGLHEFF